MSREVVKYEHGQPEEESKGTEIDVSIRRITPGQIFTILAFLFSGSVSTYDHFHQSKAKDTDQQTADHSETIRHVDEVVVPINNKLGTLDTRLASIEATAKELNEQTVTLREKVARLGQAVEDLNGTLRNNRNPTSANDALLQSAIILPASITTKVP